MTGDIHVGGQRLERVVSHGELNATEVTDALLTYATAR